MKINNNNNFARVFKIPHEFPTGFCFGGKHVDFSMVDWFNPYPTHTLPFELPFEIEQSEEEKSLTPLHDCPNQEIEFTSELREKLNKMLSEYISKKNYNDGHNLLVITNYDDSFIIKTKGLQ